MKKEFLYNIILLLVINLIVKVGYLFFIEVSVQNDLGPSEYGLYLALFNFSYLFQFINDPGIHSYNITQVAGNPDSLNYQIRRIFGLKFCLGFLFLMIVIIAGLIIGYDSKKTLLLLIIITCNHILSTFFMFLRSNLSAVGLYRKDSWISALDKVVLIGLLGYLLFFSSYDLTLIHFVLAQTISFIVASTIALLLLKPKLESLIPVIDISFYRSFLKNSFPYAIVLLLMAGYNKLDGVMLERMLDGGDFQAGIYAASLRYMDASNMVAYLFAALLMPMFAAQKEGSEMIRNLADVGIRTISILIMSICVVGIVFRDSFMSIYDVYDSQYENLLILHLLSFACVGISYIYGTLLTARRKLYYFNIILAIGLLINFSLNFTLIPRYLAEGAAFATLLTQAFVMIGQVYLSHKYFSLRIDYLLILKIITVLILTVTFSHFLKQTDNISIIFKIPLALSSVVLFSLLMKILRIDTIFALLKDKTQGIK